MDKQGVQLDIVNAGLRPPAGVGVPETPRGHEPAAAAPIIKSRRVARSVIVADGILIRGYAQLEMVTCFATARA
jgi:hypothetical protein